MVGYQTLSKKDKLTLLIGVFFLVVVGGYFFIIEPLKQKIEQTNKIIQVKSDQQTEINHMVDVLKANHAETILANHIEQIDTQGDKKLIYSKPLNEDQAKSLLFSLAPLGRTTIKYHNNHFILWHEQFLEK